MWCSAGEQSTAATHKAQLANLSKTDPEFYQFLQQEDEELLRFSDEELADESSDHSDGVDDLNQSDQSIEPVMILLLYVIAVHIVVTLGN